MEGCTLQWSFSREIRSTVGLRLLSVLLWKSCGRTHKSESNLNFKHKSKRSRPRVKTAWNGGRLFYLVDVRRPRQHFLVGRSLKTRRSHSRRDRQTVHRADLQKNTHTTPQRTIFNQIPFVTNRTRASLSFSRKFVVERISRVLSRTNARISEPLINSNCMIRYLGGAWPRHKYTADKESKHLYSSDNLHTLDCILSVAPKISKVLRSVVVAHLRERDRCH